MDAKIHGSVWLECVVTPKGVCTDIRVVRSLDSVFGLDEEAIKAVRKWRFIPGKKEQQPVHVLVTIELFFALRNQDGLRWRRRRVAVEELEAHRFAPDAAFARDFMAQENTPCAMRSAMMPYTHQGRFRPNRST